MLNVLELKHCINAKNGLSSTSRFSRFRSLYLRTDSDGDERHCDEIRNNRVWSPGVQVDLCHLCH